MAVALTDRSDRSDRQRGSYKRHTGPQRKAVLSDIPTLGLRGAARKHGIPRSTVANWCRSYAPILPLNCEPIAVQAIA